MLLCNCVGDPTQNKTKLVKEIIPDSLRLGDLSNAPRPLQMNNKATKVQMKQSLLFLLIVQLVVFAHLRLKRVLSPSPVTLIKTKQPYLTVASTQSMIQHHGLPQC